MTSWATSKCGWKDDLVCRLINANLVNFCSLGPCPWPSRFLQYWVWAPSWWCFLFGLSQVSNKFHLFLFYPYYLTPAWPRVQCSFTLMFPADHGCVSICLSSLYLSAALILSLQGKTRRLSHFQIHSSSLDVPSRFPIITSWAFPAPLWTYLIASVITFSCFRKMEAMWNACFVKVVWTGQTTSAFWLVRIKLGNTKLCFLPNQYVILNMWMNVHFEYWANYSYDMPN